jgi:small subunit ribosomal protein S20
MPKGKTDLKRFEKQEQRRVRNRSVRSTVKTYLSRAREAISDGDEQPMLVSVRRAIQTLDRAAKKGVLHPNNVARRKSRLMKRLNAASAPAAASA